MIQPRYIQCHVLPINIHFHRPVPIKNNISRDKQNFIALLKVVRP